LPPLASSDLASSDPVIASAVDAPFDEADRIARLAARCKDDPARFIHSILGDDGSLRPDHRRRKEGDKHRPALWWRQREICRSVVGFRKTLVPAGNSVGKSFLMGRLLLWFLYTHPNGIVFSTAPSQFQLDSVLWKEVRRAHGGSAMPLGGRISPSPLRIELAPGWVAYGHATNKIERITGHHADDLFAIVDEGSGVPDPIYEAVDSLNPSRMAVIGNPLWPYGRFYELCKMAEEGKPGLNLVRIPSTESPHAHLERSPYGMADRTFLESSATEYGTGSIWWKAHILAQFPDDTSESLIPSAWLELAGRAIHLAAGPRRLAIDLASGNGGDRAVLLVRDDNGILHLESSNRWGLEETAARAALLCQRFEIVPSRVSFDAGGLGIDFGNRLAGVEIQGARGYLGGASAKNAVNLRSAAAREMRRRFDPERLSPAALGSQILVKQRPFSVRPDWLAELRPELAALRSELDTIGRFALEAKEKMAARLRRSPDLADALIQSFGFY
jgi:hypothetical protein